MEDTEINDSIALSEEVQAEITAKVAELKAGDSKLRQVFPIVVEGMPDRDEKELYIAYFKEPGFVAFSRYIATSSNNGPAAMRALANDCFLAGDKDLINDDSLFLFGLMGQLSKIIEMRNGRLVNISSPRK
jgi:hypothetical protein